MVGHEHEAGPGDGHGSRHSHAGQAHGHGHGHTHDNIDWAERIPDLQQVDALHAAAYAEIAHRLTSDLRAGATVVDAGSGAGGMSAALAAALQRRGGGRLVLVDAVPELLAVAARAAARGAAAAAMVGDDAARGASGIDVADDDAAQNAGAAALAAGSAAGVAVAGNEPARGVTAGVAADDAAEGAVAIVTVQADVATDDLPSVVPAAQLVWAAHMVHHLPDQQAGTAGLARVLASGGVLAIAEGGLETECLPWDLGIGTPGFERRLLAARDDWFSEMRASIADSVRMPYGWTVALSRAGLVDVGSFSSLVDHPAPPTGAVRDFVVARTTRLVESLADRLTGADCEVARRLLDPDDEYYLGRRGDLFMLGTRTVHYGRLP